MNHKNNETPCHGKAYKNIKAQEHQSIGVVRQKEHVRVVKHKSNEVERACKSTEGYDYQNMGVMKHKSMKKIVMHKEHETQEKKSTGV